MSPNLSKTARASMGKAAKAAFVPTAAVPRVVPLAGGTHAYVRGVDGSTGHHRTSSPEFVAALVALGSAEQVTAELAALDAAYPGRGWADVATRVTAELDRTDEAD